MKQLLNGFLLCTLALACASNKQASRTNDIMVRFEKTACFGTCPTFVLEVKEDGSAELEVTNNLNLSKGKYVCANCNTLQLKHILDKAEEIGFDKLDGKYDSGVTDLPSVITTIRGKQVINVLDGPLALTELEKQINHAYIESGVWKKKQE